MKTDTIILVLYFATTGHVAISPVITSIYHCQTGGRTGIYQDPAKWKNDGKVFNKESHLFLPPHHAHMLKSYFTLSLGCLEQNLAYTEPEKECGCKGKKKTHEETHQYTTTPAAWSLKYLKWDPAERRQWGGRRGNQGWMGRKIIPVHTHSSLQEKRKENVNGMHGSRT